MLFKWFLIPNTENWNSQETGEHRYCAVICINLINFGYARVWFEHKFHNRKTAGQVGVRRLEAISFPWSLEMEERGTNVKIALGMGYCLNSGARHCLKWHYFPQAAVVPPGVVVAPNGFWASFLRAWICPGVRVVFPQGSSKVFRIYQLFSAFSFS